MDATPKKTPFVFYFTSLVTLLGLLSIYMIVVSIIGFPHVAAFAFWSMGWCVLSFFSLALYARGNNVALVIVSITWRSIVPPT